jgi:hypothetical protein
MLAVSFVVGTCKMYVLRNLSTVTTKKYFL